MHIYIFSLLLSFPPLFITFFSPSFCPPHSRPLRSLCSLFLSFFTSLYNIIIIIIIIIIQTLPPFLSFYSIPAPKHNLIDHCDHTFHSSGSQEFWASTDEKKLWAYLYYRLADIYADVITHEQPGGVDAIAVFAAILHDITGFRERFFLLLEEIRAQRKTHDSEWKPTVADCKAVMETYADHRLRIALAEKGRQWGMRLAVAAAVVGIGAWLFLRTRKWNGAEEWEREEERIYICACVWKLMCIRGGREG